MQAEVHMLHQSDFYQIRDFQCACTECSTSRLEQCERFAICFVRRGYYEQHVYRKQQEMHAGRLLVSKPGIEYFIRHIENQPDLCTSINFTDAFYQRVRDHYRLEAGWFFRNPDLQSVLLATPPAAEFLHRQILDNVHRGQRLEIDELVIHLTDIVLRALGNAPVPPSLPETLRKHHLSTVENARDYLFRNFDRNISLQEISDHCCVSLFHFVRIFKAILNTTPHRYLLELRLQHAHLLISSTAQPITEIAFQSGFNSLEHFTTAYRKHFGDNPSRHRKGTARDR